MLDCECRVLLFRKDDRKRAEDKKATLLIRRQRCDFYVVRISITDLTESREITAGSSSVCKTSNAHLLATYGGETVLKQINLSVIEARTADHRDPFHQPRRKERSQSVLFEYTKKHNRSAQEKRASHARRCACSRQ